MSQDIISDTLNQIMNAKRAGKKEAVVARHSKLLLELLKLAKKHGYIEEFGLSENKLSIKLGKLNECKAIKPRFNVKINELDNKARRFLPSRDFGIIILTTSRGLITHEEACKENIGGQLLAYFY